MGAIKNEWKGISGVQIYIYITIQVYKEYRKDNQCLHYIQ